MLRKQTLCEKIDQRIARKKVEDVVLARRFKTLGRGDQVLHTLRKLVGERRLAGLGYAV